MPTDPRPHVLVAGAGPVGLTAAHELARRGLRVRLVDAAPGPARTSRAVAVHPRTLETFDQMGVVGAVRRDGRENRAFTMYATGRRLVRLDADYTSMPTRYPYTVIIEQTRTEAALRAAVTALGVEIEWGIRLDGFSQDAQGVHVRLVRADGGAEDCRADWLVGCDGGHSTVRKQLGLPLIGESRDTWMLADAPVRTDLPQDTIYWVHTGGQALMMVPYARTGHWRLLDTAPGGAAAETAPARFSAKLSKGLGRDVRVGEPEWTSVFTFQQRMVPRMHEGRVFVAGDAAHVHSPASGQGMNTGIQEAYNLAWKIADVHRGHAGRQLLDSYSAERVPIGKALLGSTRTATFLVQFKNLLAAAALPVVFTVVRNVAPLRRAIQRKVLGGMSGLRLGYQDSPLTTPAPRRRDTTTPAPGQRAALAAARQPQAAGPAALHAELRDPRWTLLCAPGAETAEGPTDTVPVDTAATADRDHAAWLSVRTVADRRGGVPGPLPDPGGALREALGLGPGGWVLIRPDGYVAARGTRLTPDGLQQALAPFLREPAPAEQALKEASSALRAAQGTLETTVALLEAPR
ncbi:FAD-dependent oxidoreductase [Streptomyces monticola]|uniref:FAD-dependent oxidoreductase n=1 Tax=Streptomyces monticola TaxID=2666263 RepID=A0ABW2JXL8_9ACTN